MSKNRYPIIDESLCTGCMLCNNLCRHGVYKPDEANFKPKVTYTHGCIEACRLCAKKCPTGAIRYFGDDGTSDINYDFEHYKPVITCEGKPKVAFICNHNSCRSQMAEALGKLLATDVFQSYSAGTEIKHQINQDAVRLIKDLYTVDMEETQRNKTIAEIPAPEVVIFMGCNVSCPYLPSQYAENWGLDDPSGKSDEEFKDIITQIHTNVIRLKEKLS